MNLDKSRIAALLFRRVGDSLLAVPALRAIKNFYPDAHISVLCEPQVVRVFQGHSFVDSVCNVGSSPTSFELVRSIKKEKSTVTLDFLSDPRTAIACALFRAPVRVGFAKSLRGYLYTHRVGAQDPKAPVYSALHKLEFAKLLNVSWDSCSTEFTLTKENCAEAARLFGELGSKRVAMYITSRREYKRWPLERYAEIARRITGEGFEIAVLGGPGEESVAREFCGLAGLPEYSVARFQDLGDMAAFLNLCSCYLGNDGGPKHLAVAVGTPTVTVFQNDPWEYWTPPNDPLHRALGGANQVPDVEDVWQAVEELLARDR